MNSSAIEVRGLTRRYAKVTALDALTFDVAEGELFGLVGPDGAGKTTLFRILTTLLLPDSGSARVLGLDVVRDMWAIRSRVGYMPGGFSLYPDLSVIENLEFFASVFGTTVEAGYELIAPVYRQIEPFKHRRADALSGGMKQKLALSCALVHRPDLLLLDEPTTGVDAVSRREFWDQLGALRASGLTILVSTPYMDEAVRCDRVALIQGGRILEVDSARAISERFARPLLSVKGANRYALLQGVRGFPHAHSVYPFGEELHYADRRTEHPIAAIMTELAEYLAAHGHGIVEIQPIAAGIEDRFMDLMGSAPAATAA